MALGHWPRPFSFGGGAWPRSHCEPGHNSSRRQTLSGFLRRRTVRRLVAVASTSLTPLLLATCNDLILPAPPPADSLLTVTAPESLSIAINGALAIRDSVTVRWPQGGLLENAHLAWASLGTNVASVDTSGVIHARARGSDSIRVWVVSGSAGLYPPADTVPVRVIVAGMRPDGLTDLLSALGDSLACGARIEYLDANGSTISPTGLQPTCESSDTTITGDPAGGWIVARRNGNAAVRATLDTSGVDRDVTVQQRAAGVTITRPKGFVFRRRGETRQFEDSAWDRRGHFIVPRATVWKSSDPTIVSIDSTTGIATAHRDGEVLLQATLDSVADSQPAGVSIPCCLAFENAPSDAVAGAPITPLRVTARNSLGIVDTTASNNVVLSIRPGSGTTGANLRGIDTATARKGVATFSGLSIDSAGANYQLLARSSDLDSAASESFNVTPAPPILLQFARHPGDAIAGGSVGEVTIVIRDSLGNKTAAEDFVAMAITEGTGTAGANLRGTRVGRASDGIATFSDLNIDSAGTGYTLTANAAQRTGDESNQFSIVAGPAVRLAFTVQPTDAPAGSDISPAVRVTVQDSLGNTVKTSGDSVLVEIGNNPGGGTLSGTLKRRAVDGVASFPDLRISASGGGYTLVATAASLSADESDSFDISPPAAKLAFITTPGEGVAGAPLTPPLQVEVQDADGNRVTTASHPITMRIALGTGKIGARLRGDTVVAAESGLATFADLSIDSVGIGYQLTASAPGLAGTTSGGFNIVAAPPARLRFVSQPSDTDAGATIAPAIGVAVEDSLGNRVSAATDLVTIEIGNNAGGGILSGDNTQVPTDGVATFDDLSINVQGLDYTLKATATGLTDVESEGFDVRAGAVSGGNSSLTAAPASIVASSGSSSSTITVTARNANSIPVAGASVSLLVSGTDNTFSPPTGTTNGNGVFTSTFSSTKAEEKTISATIDGFSVVQQAIVTVNPTSATKLVFSGQPSDTRVNDDISPAPAVTVRDAFDNTASQYSGNVSVDFGDNLCGGTLSGTKNRIPQSGVATFSGLSVDVACDNYTLTATSGSLSVESETFDVYIPVPAAPVPSLPGNGSTTSDNTPTFDWSDPAYAYRYHLQVDNSGCSFPSPEINESNLSVSIYTPSNQLGDATYYWHVRARNSVGVWGNWSACWSVRVDAYSDMRVWLDYFDVVTDGDAGSEHGELFGALYVKTVFGDSVSIWERSSSNTLQVADSTFYYIGAYNDFTIRNTSAGAVSTFTVYLWLKEDDPFSNPDVGACERLYTWSEATRTWNSSGSSACAPPATLIGGGVEVRVGWSVGRRDP